MTPNEIVATINAARSKLYTAHHVEADENKVHAVALRAFDKVVAGLNTLAVPTPEQWTEIAKQGSELRRIKDELEAKKRHIEGMRQDIKNKNASIEKRVYQKLRLERANERLKMARFTLGAVKLQTDAVQGQDDVVKARAFDTIVKLVETWWQGEKNKEEVLV